MKVNAAQIANIVKKSGEQCFASAQKRTERYLQKSTISAISGKGKKMRDLKINKFAQLVHQNAVKHGWWDTDPKFPELAVMIHSEVSEAVDEWRNKKPDFYYDKDKPCGVAIELIDVLLRTLDLLAAMGVDTERLLTIKHSYDRTRTYRHGGKRC